MCISLCIIVLRDGVSEWVSEWVSHTQTDIPTRLPWWWRFIKAVFSVRCLLRLKKQLNNERGHRVVCKYCGRMSWDFTWLVSIHIVTLEVQYSVWMWTTLGAVARMSWAPLSVHLQPWWWRQRSVWNTGYELHFHTVHHVRKLNCVLKLWKLWILSAQNEHTRNRAESPCSRCQLAWYMHG